MSQGKFEGTSRNGDIQEALATAIAAAKDGLQTDLVSWRIEELSGQDGGFTLVHDVTVTIHAVIGPQAQGDRGGVSSFGNRWHRKEVSKDAKVYSVEKVSLHINKTNPPQLVVHAIGKVNSSGWKNGRLIPWVYVQPPPDGILDFEFIASAPSGAVLWVMSPIEGIGTVQMHNSIKGVRIHAGTNLKEAMLSDKDVAAEVKMIASDFMPWPW